MANPGGEISNEQLWMHLQALFGGRIPGPHLGSGNNPTSTTRSNALLPTPIAPGLPSVDPFFSAPPNSQTPVPASAPVTAFPLPPSSQLAPPISQYQSTRLGVPHQNHGGLGGSISLNMPSSTNALPHVNQSSVSHGGRGLRSFTNTSTANQQRMASAATHIPRPPALQPQTATAGAARGRRRRGPALRAPSIATGPRLEDTFIRDPTQSSGIQAIRLRIKVYPSVQGHSASSSDSYYFLYRFHQEEFNRQLQSLGLLYDLEMDHLTAISDLIRNITSRMTDGPFAYIFRRSQRVPQQRQQDGPYGNLALGLLGLVNRGRPRTSDNQIRLTLQPCVGLDINRLLDQGPRYAVPEICVEEDRFVIHFAILRSNVSALLPARNSLGRTSNMRRHTCISARLYGLFPDDGFDHSSDLPGETSGGEDNGVDEEVDNESAASDSASQGTPTPMATANQLEFAAPPTTPSPHIPALNTILPFWQQPSIPNDFPPVLWSTAWNPPITISRPASMEDLEDTIFELSAGTNSTNSVSFELIGETVNDLANELIKAIQDALKNDDFSKILSSGRSFKIISNDEHGQFTRSVGRGIEQETVYLAFEQFTRNSGQWFLSRAGGYSTIATSHSSGLSAATGSPRLEKLAILGALTSLMLIYGIVPSPLSPILLHYFFHDCRLESIHAKLVAEWLPELHQTLQEWLALDHNSNIAQFQGHFATYHDIQIACLSERDLSTHKSLASEMLYRAIIGPQPVTHPEFQAFLKGFHLQCRSGFTIKKINELVEGGSEAFLNVIWTSQIKSFDDLEPHISLPLPGSLIYSQLAAIVEPFGLTFKDMIHAYFRGVGIPCRQLFQAAQLHFSSLIDLSLIEDPSFRSRMFCWAATGSPSIDISSDGISIHISGCTDSYYSSAQPRRDTMMAEGKFCFKTCIKQVRIPLVYLERLAESSYSSADEPSSFQNAFDHWFLCETLNAIGHHSIM